MGNRDDTPPTNPRRSVQLLSLLDFKESAQRVIDAVARGRPNRALFVELSTVVHRLHRACIDEHGRPRYATPLTDDDKTPVDFARSGDWHLRGDTVVAPLPSPVAESGFEEFAAPSSSGLDLRNGEVGEPDD